MLCTDLHALEVNWLPLNPTQIGSFDFDLYRSPWYPVFVFKATRLAPARGLAPARVGWLVGRSVGRSVGRLGGRIPSITGFAQTRAACWLARGWVRPGFCSSFWAASGRVWLCNLWAGLPKPAQKLLNEPHTSFKSAPSQPKPTQSQPLTLPKASRISSLYQA